MASTDDIKPFNINIPEEKLELLKKKLELTTFPDEIFPNDHTQGPPLSLIRRLVSHWKTSYSWRDAEAELNQFPQYITPIEVDGFQPLNVHFLHINKGSKGAIPLIIIHGWPGSFYELTKIVRDLGDGEGPKFEIIVPSLIGFGFSDGAKTPGFSSPKQAEMCHKLMLKLGFNEYVAQGGDWGMVITHIMATTYYPTHLKAAHINNSDIYTPPSLFKNPLYWLQNTFRGPYTEDERRGIERTERFMKEGFGYNLMHKYRPQTIGYGVSDSPVGLLGWILDKLVDWTDDYPWTNDEILTWVSIYHFSTAGPTASMRLYFESTRVRLSDEDMKKINGWARCPMGISCFPKDINVTPMAWARPMGNFVFERKHKEGGHFAAWEKPKLLAGDLEEMFAKGGVVYGVVEGRDGY